MTATAAALPRLVGSLMAGAIAAVTVGLLDDAQVAALAGIAVAATAFVVWGWLALWPMDADRTRSSASSEVFRPLIDELVVLVAALAGLGGVCWLLVRGSRADDLTAALALLDVLMAWAGLHLVYATRYAAIYYGGTAPGGIDFNGPQDPTFRDFFYFSYNLGMTYQVSDTDVSSPAIREVVLRQSLVSYLFGAAIIATAINLVVGVISG